MVFNPAPFYHIRNDDLSFVMLIVCGFIRSGTCRCSFSSRAGRRTPRFERGGRQGTSASASSTLRPTDRRLHPFLPVDQVPRASQRSRPESHRAPGRPRRSKTLPARHPEGLAVAPPFHETFLAFLPTFFTRLDRFTLGAPLVRRVPLHLLARFRPVSPMARTPDEAPHDREDMGGLPSHRAARAHPADLSASGGRGSRISTTTGRTWPTTRSISSRALSPARRHVSKELPVRVAARIRHRARRNRCPPARRAEGLHGHVGRARGIRGCRMVLGTSPS